MKFALLIGASCLLPAGNEADAVTGAKHRKAVQQIVTQQLIPLETQKAGQDVELRKVQALLSGQRPKNAPKANPRN